jgi:phosphatidylinositol alpha-1,6-mannosyltransferase
MRVVLVSANFRPHVGGIERFTEILASGLAKRGHDVRVICCRHGDGLPTEQVDGFSIDRVTASYVLDRRLNVPYPVPTPRGLVVSIRRALAQADVVHVQDVLYATSFPTLLLARRLRVPSVITQHVAFVRQRTRVLDAVERAALMTLGRCARLASAVATLNPTVAEWVGNQWKIDDVRVLPVGIPAPAGETRDRADVRRSFGLPANRFLGLFVGRDVPKKGLDVFLAAADPAYDLVAVTDRAVSSASATVIPFMSPERLQELLQCVDAFVLPSEDEGFPVSLQEALASGLPVVTTSQPGYERFLAPEDVVFVDREARSVREALIRLAEDDSLRRRLGERSRVVAERHFGVTGFVEAYENLYEEVRTPAGAR